ncbi:unnamed protein product [Amoebophrya sp. A120]|nr:unnamed protein product [Amoebophrya sp. A120]|eukprot:GSA120T00000664001.1
MNKGQRVFLEACKMRSLAWCRRRRRRRRKGSVARRNRIKTDSESETTARAKAALLRKGGRLVSECNCFSELQQREAFSVVAALFAFLLTVRHKLFSFYSTDADEVIISSADHGHFPLHRRPTSPYFFARAAEDVHTTTRRTTTSSAPTTHLQLTLDETLQCQGSEFIRSHVWGHLKQYTENWMDIPIRDSTMFEKLVLAIDHNSLLEQHAADCGFGLLVLLLGSLRSMDYNHGSAIALYFYRFVIDRLLPDLRELFALDPDRVNAAGWEKLLENEDALIEDELVPYGPMLGYDPAIDESPHPGVPPPGAYPCKHGLKIFIYDFPDLTTGPLHCHHGQWGVETLIPEWIRRSECHTTDGANADFYLVPWYTWCQRMVIPLNRSDGEIDAVYVSMMKNERLTYFRKNEGADHIFLMSDQGLIFWTSWRDYVPHSIFLTTEAFTPNCGRPCHQPWKDIVIPGHTDYFRSRRMRKFDLPTNQRPLLFNFHGRHAYILKQLGRQNYAANTLRRHLVDLFGDFEEFGEDEEYLESIKAKMIDKTVPKPYHGRISVGGFTDDFFERMGASHFCLVPHGNTSWTNHLYNAFFAGCIPVILSDNMEVPFEDLLDWKTFSVKWNQENISESLFYDLQKFSYQQIFQMKQEVAKHQCWFDYNLRNASECSPYQAVMAVLAKKAKILPTKYNFGSEEKWWGAVGGPNIWDYMPVGTKDKLLAAQWEH